VYFSVSEEYIPYTFRMEIVCVANTHVHTMIFWVLTRCRLVAVYQKLQIVVPFKEGNHMPLNMGSITRRTTIGTWGFAAHIASLSGPRNVETEVVAEVVCQKFEILYLDFVKGDLHAR
jgi:hypothetical protein